MNSREDILKNLESQIHQMSPDATYKWLPAIGKSYLGAKRKIAILGESTYETHWHSKPDFHSALIYQVINKQARWPLFSNIQRTLEGGNLRSKESFWSEVAFWNIVREPMENIKVRPSRDQYVRGINVSSLFFDALEPDLVLVFSKASSDLFLEYFNTEHHEPKAKYPITKIGRNSVRHWEVKQRSGASFEMLFIPHASSYYSWSKYHTLLKDRNITPGASNIPLSLILAQRD